MPPPVIMATYPFVKPSGFGRLVCLVLRGARWSRNQLHHGARAVRAWEREALNDTQAFCREAALAPPHSSGVPQTLRNGRSHWASGNRDTRHAISRVCIRRSGCACAGHSAMCWPEFCLVLTLGCSYRFARWKWWSGRTTSFRVERYARVVVMPFLLPRSPLSWHS